VEPVDDMERHRLWKDVEQTSANKKSSTKKANATESDNPEYDLLVADMIAKLRESKEILEPILDAYSQGKLGDCKALEFVRLKYRLCNFYSLIVSSYGMLLCSGGRDKVVNHPVMKKIATYTMLFKQLLPMDTIMMPQLTELVKRLKQNKSLNLIHPPTISDKIKNVKKLSILKSKAVEEEKEEDEHDMDSDEHDGKYILCNNLLVTDSVGYSSTENKL